MAHKFKVTLPNNAATGGGDMAQRLKAVGLTQSTESGDPPPPIWFQTAEGAAKPELDVLQSIVTDYGGTVEAIDQE